MTDYVAGFLFNRAQQAVLLIEKKRPAWQAGKLNGIGGKIEPGETPYEAMVREFREEAGVEIRTWEPTVILQGDAWRVYFFRAFTDENLYGILPQTDEELWTVTLPLNDFARPATIPNLAWLIPLSLQSDTRFPIHVMER